MKIVCTQSTLNTNLSLVSRAVPSRPTHPVLGNVLLVADEEKGRLDLTAFDLSLGIRTSFSATVIESGTLALPAKLLNDIVSRLPESEITISDEPDPEALEDERATLTTGAGRFKINQEKNVEEYPEFPPVEAGQSLVLPVSALTDGLRGVLFAASTDETKQVLTGVHLTRTEAGLEFAATDSHRLAVVQTAASEVEERSVETESDPPPSPSREGDRGGGSVGREDFEVTIPARALRELKQMLGSLKEGACIQLKVDEGQVVFDLDTRHLRSQKLEGQYPDYRRLIPQQFSRQITLERKELLRGLELVAVLADQKNNTVKFSLHSDKQELDLSVETQDVGSAKQSMSAQIVGESIEIAFNIKYLMDGLKALRANEIKMQLNEGDRPVIFTPESSIKMTYLVMPVQMRN